MPDGIRLLPQRRESEALSALSQLLQERELGLSRRSLMPEAAADRWNSGVVNCKHRSMH